MDKLYLAALQMVPGIGNARLKSLIALFGSARQAWQANRRDLFLCQCLDEVTCNNLLNLREKIDIQNLSVKWESKGIKLCAITDNDYPSQLRNIYNPPSMLYYRGQLPATENLLAIVGVRQASVYGKNVAQLLGAELAAAGFWIVSGAARGIDTAAHKGALTRGYTIAVLGSGVDVSYPPENKKLLDGIAEQGAVISEYAPGTMPHSAFFPARNRIINGLSRGVVVVEAAEKSGALITADYALEEGRDVFAVPGSIFSTSSKGVHRLIKQGAKLVDCAADVLEEYQIFPTHSNEEPAVLTQDEKIIYDQLSYDEPLTIEEIVLKANLAVAVVTYILLQLELRGLAAECSPQRYVRAAGEGIR